MKEMKEELERLVSILKDISVAELRNMASRCKEEKNDLGEALVVNELRRRNKPTLSGTDKLRLEYRRRVGSTYNMTY